MFRSCYTHILMWLFYVYSQISVIWGTTKSSLLPMPEAPIEKKALDVADIYYKTSEATHRFRRCL